VQLLDSLSSPYTPVTAGQHR